MTESLINEWLSDCANLSRSEYGSFANTLSQDQEIIRALYALFEERAKYNQLTDTVCNQLFDFYRSSEVQLQLFTLQFLPTLIYIYLNAAAHGEIKNCRTVETLLIGLYNLEVVDKDGEKKAVSFRLPSLAMLSIFHEPASLAPASLTESAVRRFEECNTRLVSWGPLQQIETLNAQNRLKIMTALLFIYNQQLSHFGKHSLEQLCKVATKLVTQGFTKPGHHQRSSYGSESSFVPRLLPRIPVSSQFLLEFLQAVYFAMYNDCWYVGNQAVEDIHNRACYEGYADAMLVTNAIRNSSSSSGPTGLTGDGSMGISVALSPATATATVSKSMITNASFRTKKLPDDIPIQDAKDESGGELKVNLVSISEEQESIESNRAGGGSMRQSKDLKSSSKISANFPGLGKKTKEKDAKVTRNSHVTSSGDKEKKFGVQVTLKSASNEQIEADAANNIVKKKVVALPQLENNSVAGDSVASSNLLEMERLNLAEEAVDSNGLDPTLRPPPSHNDSSSMSEVPVTGTGSSSGSGTAVGSGTGTSVASSVQVSSV